VAPCFPWFLCVCFLLQLLFITAVPNTSLREWDTFFPIKTLCVRLLLQTLSRNSWKNHLGMDPHFLLDCNQGPPLSSDFCGLKGPRRI
jgi:hypothetical protein